MNANEITRMGAGMAALPMEEVLEGWKSIVTSFRENADSVHRAYETEHEILNKQNDIFMSIIEDPNSSPERFEEACCQAREIRNGARNKSSNEITDMIKVIGAVISAVAIGLGGAQGLKSIR